ncbi:enoyl-CoA hydratase/isomerase family protein [Shewanella salipaludis]|nr:enoyl-CoA hydratase/isomerase family protein [Shewanella salipaludis]
MEEPLMTQDVLFTSLATMSGKRIGLVTLNLEKALNALNLEMVHAMTEQLLAWQQDDSIACIMLDGSGTKAFCAGGDVRALYQAAKDTPGVVTPQACEFFTSEYRLDYLLHTYGKPVLVWGAGIVMGGGLGLMAGASHRVVTDTSRIAMPEVTIGLYPDVGGSYFLNRMPGKTGLFLGLTAYNLDAADALYVGLGNHHLGSDAKQALLDAMSGVGWDDNQQLNHTKLSALLEALSQPVGDSRLQRHQAQIDELMSGDIVAIVQRMTELETDVSWLSKARAGLLAGSPISLHLMAAQARLGTELSLAQVFRWELGVSVNTCAKGDFREGVRALLIDKDRTPKWHYASVAAVPAELIAELQQSPWDDNQHPLKALG